MATKTFYVLNTAASTPFFGGSLQEGGTAPTAANSSFGWQPAKTAITTAFWKARLGATAVATVAAATTTLTAAPAKGTGSGATTAGDAFRSPSAYSGSFAATAWTFAWNMRAGTAGAIGRLRMRVWRSVNADGTSATEITSATQVGATITLSTSADTNSSMSWSPGAVSLTNEYLFFQLEWEETTAGTSNTDTVLFRIGTASITTPNFAGLYTDTVSFAAATAIGPNTGTGKVSTPAVTLSASTQAIAAAGGIPYANSISLAVANAISPLDTMLTADTWNPADHNTSASLSSGNMAATSSDTFGTVASIKVYSSGKHYFEIKQTSGASSGNNVFGMGSSSSCSMGGTSDDSVVCWGNGWAAYNNSFIQIFGGLGGTGADIWMLAWDGDAKKCWFGLNGTWNGSPGVSGGFDCTSPAAANYNWHVVSAIGVIGAVNTLNCGQSAFSYTPPTGFSVETTGASYQNSASLSVATAIGPTTGTARTSTPTATLNVSPVSTPLGSLLMSATSSLAIATAIGMAGSGIPYNASATLALATAIAAAGTELMTGSGSLSVATVLGTTTGTTRTSTPTATLSVATAIDTTTGTTRVSTPTATLSFSPVITSAVALTANPTATVSFSPAMAASAGAATYSSTATINFSPSITGAASTVMPVSGSLAVTSSIAAVGGAASSGGNALSPTAIFNATLSNGNLTVSGVTSTSYGVSRSVKAYASGKLYFEIYANATSSGGNSGFGICDSSTNVPAGDEQGGDLHSAGIYANGYVGINNSFQPTACYVQDTGDRYMFAIDLDNKRLYFGKNGVWCGVNFAACDPAAGTGYLDVSALTGSAWYLILSLDTDDVFTVNFGASNFTYAPPTGFSGDAGSPTYDDSISLAASPAIAASALKTSAPTATLSVATAETPSSALVGSSTAALSVSPVITPAGGLSFNATATISFAPVETAASLLSLTGAATISVVPEIFASAGAATYNQSATIDTSPAISALTPVLSFTLNANMALNPIITPAGIQTMNPLATLSVSPAVVATYVSAPVTSSATLSFSPAITPSSIEISAPTATISVSPVIAASTPGANLLASATILTNTAETATNTRVGSNTAIINTSPDIASLSVWSAIGQATLSLAPVTTALGGVARTSALSLAVTSSIAPTGLANMNALGSVDVNSGIGPSGTFNANLSATLAVTAAISASSGAGGAYQGTVTLSIATGLAAAGAISATPSISLATTIGIATLGGLIASASAALAVVPGTAASAQTTINAAVALSTATGLSTSTIKTILEAASVAVATAMATSSTNLMNTSASLNVQPATSAIEGSTSFTNATSFAMTSSIIAAVVGALQGTSTLATVSGISPSSKNLMSDAVAYSISESTIGTAVNRMNVAISFAESFGELSGLFGQDYQFAVALAAATALTTAGRLDLAGRATVSAAIAELVQSGNVMQAVTAYSASVAQNLTAAVSLFQNASFATTVGVGPDGRTTVQGTIAMNAAAGSIANVLNNAPFGQLSFSARYGVEPGNVLTARDAVTIATRFVVRALTEDQHPLIDVLSVKGIWQGEFDLAGIYKTAELLDGIFQGSEELLGRYDDQEALEGVMQMTVTLDGRA